MKNFILFAIFMVLTLITFSQQINYAHTLEKQDYLQKGKKQKTAARVLLGGGCVLFTIGTLMAATEVTTEVGGYIVAGLTGTVAEEPKASNTSGILFFTGLASMVGSIPLFVASSRNKRTAATISTSIIFEEGSLVRNLAQTKIQFPAVAVKINL